MNNLHPLTKCRRQTSGFTIVELLVVIVVIGILAAITIVVFNGARDRAIDSAVKSDLSNSAKALENYHTVNGKYPESTAEANGGAGLKSATDATYQYTVDNGTNQPSYCLTLANSKTSFHVSNTAKSPAEGVCEGHTAPGGASTATAAQVLESYVVRPPADVTTSYPLSTNLQPDDTVIVIWSKYYTGSVYVSGYGKDWPIFYGRSLYSGTTYLGAYKMSGLSGSGSVNLRTAGTSTNVNTALILVVRGLNSGVTTAYQEIGWGTTYNTTGTVIGPASTTVGPGQIAFYMAATYTGSSAHANFLVNPTPATGWTTHIEEYGVRNMAVAHYAPSETTTVQANLKTNTNDFVASTMMVFGTPQ